MIRLKDHKQQQLFDPWAYLSPKRRKKLDLGWPGLFREHLLEEMPVDQMVPFFHQGFGRPTKELHTVLGVLLFQQAMDLTDTEAIDQLEYNIQWHYALGITEESDDAKSISEKTLWSMRKIMAENNLDEVMFDSISDKLAEVFKVDTTHQRIDSVHIRSNMRKLGRITIFSQTIHKFLVNLKRQHRELFDSIQTDVIERYWGNKALSAFSMVKPSESQKTLKMVSNDLFDLIEQFKDQPAVCSMHSYKLMQRVLADQCHIETDGDKDKKVTVKKPADVSSDSLQNPSDPDATYDGHKGQGYQVQVMETFTRDEDEKEENLNLITHVAVQTACESDANALIPAIADTKVRGVEPDEVLADTLYGSDFNHQVAQMVDIKLVAPVPKGKESKPLSNFTFDQNGYITACPAGHGPDKVKHKKKTGRYSASFDPALCQGCPLIEQCPVKKGKKKNHVRYSEKQQRLATRRSEEKSDAFKERYNKRAGVEATMSEYDRRTGVKKLRVRCKKAVRFCAKLKAAGLNMLRAARVRKARAKAHAANRGNCIPFRRALKVVKELFQCGAGIIASEDFKLAA